MTHEQKEVYSIPNKILILLSLVLILILLKMSPIAKMLPVWPSTADISALSDFCDRRLNECALLVEIRNGGIDYTTSHEVRFGSSWWKRRFNPSGALLFREDGPVTLVWLEDRTLLIEAYESHAEHYGEIPDDFRVHVTTYK